MYHVSPLTLPPSCVSWLHCRSAEEAGREGEVNGDQGAGSDVNAEAELGDELHVHESGAQRVVRPPRHTGSAKLDPETARLARIMHGCRTTTGNVRAGDGWSSDEFDSECIAISTQSDVGTSYGE